MLIQRLVLHESEKWSLTPLCVQGFVMCHAFGCLRGRRGPSDNRFQIQAPSIRIPLPFLLPGSDLQGMCLASPARPSLGKRARSKIRVERALSFIMLCERPLQTFARCVPVPFAQRCADCLTNFRGRHWSICKRTMPKCLSEGGVRFYFVLSHCGAICGLSFVTQKHKRQTQ